MRLRALVLLLVLTAGDYLLWDWSIADSHDIVSLVAGLTLLPLAAVSLGGLVLAGGRLLRRVAGRPVSAATGRSRHASVSERAQQATTADSDTPSSRLAA